MSFTVTGTIKTILPLEKGTSKASGKEWQKLNFVIETDEQYNNIYCLEVFGAEKVENFQQTYHVGDSVKADFNVNSNEWNGKFFTSLSMWRMDVQAGTSQVPVQTPPPNNAPAGQNEDLPF